MFLTGNLKAKLKKLLKNRRFLKNGFNYPVQINISLVIKRLKKSN